MIMKIFTIILAILLYTADYSFSQYARFPLAGIVEYEKSVNMFALLKKRADKDKGGFMSQIYESYKKTQPQFRKLKSTLSFTGNKSLFKPDESSEANSGFFGNEPPILLKSQITENIKYLLIVV